ncbi:MAG: J domain-containing protein [Ignavibacteriaceae bacterium]|mgnify:CR=1 FL=1|nr:J domain-containing protein [Ignavibacteriaceae bacterium]HRI47122.1 J domain-containing protein [Ignavibacteriaceae bacterium]
MNVRKIRTIADSLFEQGKYDDAFYIYNEIYSKIWGAIGRVQTGFTDFSQSFLGNSFKSNYDLRTNFSMQAVDSIFKRWFDMDSDQTLNEFTFTTYGHLQCICYSPVLASKISTEYVYSEFIILQTLILQSDKDDWINYLLKVVTPMMEDGHLKKIRSNLTNNFVKNLLVENSQLVKSTDWFNLNVIFLDYLVSVGDNSSQLYTSVHNVVGSYYRHKTHRRKTSNTRDNSGQKQSKKSESYESYERYEKYERYERFEKHHAHNKNEFDTTIATEAEKSVHYGKILGLTGKVSKSQIRKKYLDLIAKYHPDKVSELGDEIKLLAETKTKQLNAAYEWMKHKYNL